VCTLYKNRSDFQVCFGAETLILPEEHVLPNKQQKKMWDLHTTAVVENEDTLHRQFTKTTTLEKYELTAAEFSCLEDVVHVLLRF